MPIEEKQYAPLSGVSIAGDGAATTVAVDAFAGLEERIVDTERGACTVLVSDAERALVNIVTYHDIGLDPESCFANWINHPHMAPVLKHARWFHIIAPGHENGAVALGGDTYTMDDLAGDVGAVIDEFKLTNVIGVGCGVGGNVLLRHVIVRPRSLCGLVLVSTVGAGQGWGSWAQQLLSAGSRSDAALSTREEDALVRHYVGHTAISRCTDLTEILKGKLRARNPANVRRLQRAFDRKTDIRAKIKERLKGFNVLFVLGNEFTNMADATNMYDVLDASCSSYMKIAYAGGLAHEQFPDKVARAFKLFVQGAVSSTAVVLNNA